MTTEQLAVGADARYYTFGQDHRFPDGREAQDEYIAVIVSGGYDPRDVLIGWLGGNGFASEYDLDSWPAVRDKHYAGQDPAVILAVLDQPKAGSGQQPREADELDFLAKEFVAGWEAAAIGAEPREGQFASQVEEFVSEVEKASDLEAGLRLSLIVTATNAQFLYERSVDLGGEVGMFLSAVSLFGSAQEIFENWKSGEQP